MEKGSCPGYSMIKYFCKWYCRMYWNKGLYAPVIRRLYIFNKSYFITFWYRRASCPGNRRTKYF